MSNKKDNLAGFRVHTREYKTKLTTKYKNRKQWQAPNPNEIRSYIPGTIIELKVKVGQKVKAGESVLVLEAMKMQNQIAMPFDGKIVDVCVKAGDKIPKNEIMIVVE